MQRIPTNSMTFAVVPTENYDKCEVMYVASYQVLRNRSTCDVQLIQKCFPFHAQDDLQCVALRDQCALRNLHCGLLRDPLSTALCDSFFYYCSCSIRRAFVSSSTSIGFVVNMRNTLQLTSRYFVIMLSTPH